MIELARRVTSIKPSPTLSISARAQELKRAGRKILSLSVGEPDFPTPDHVCQAAKKAIDEGFTRYTPVNGIPELREAIAEKFWKDHGLRYTHEEILVSAGGKQAIFNLLLALIQPGDEVLIPSPYWVSYPDMVKLAEGIPVIVETHEEEGFKLSPEALERSIGEKSKLLILNSPSNPTGMCYTKDELFALGEVIRRHPHVFVASDDIYEKIVFDGQPFATFAQVNPDLKERTITLNGVSKAYCMTGWRIGYCAGPKPLIQAMSKIQSQSTSNPCAISQKAALAALTGPQDDLKRMVDTYARRRRWLVERLRGMRGVSCILPDGAFYVFPSIQGWFGLRPPSGDPIKDDIAACSWLLNEADVALVPGSAFGCPGHVRISYAVSQEELEEAVNRISSAAESLE